MTEPQGVAAKPSGGMFEDLIDVFAKPAALFDRVRNTGFMRPVLIQTVLFLALSIGLGNLNQPFMDAEFARGFAKAEAKAAANGQPMPPQAKAMAEKMQGITKYALPLLAPIMTALLGGLVVWGCAMVVGARTSYGNAATIASWAMTPTLLGIIVMAIFGMMMSAESVRGMGDGQLGAAKFVDPNTTSPFLLTVLQRLDVFSLWEVVLTGIGISVITRTPRATGYLAAGIRWLIVVLVFGFCASRA